MRVEIERMGLFSDLKSILKNMDRDKYIKSIFIIDCINNEYDSGLFDPVLKDLKKPVFGGMFPGIIYEESLHYKGTIIVGFFKEAKVEIFENIGCQWGRYTNRLKEYSKLMKFNKTVIVNIDGLSKGIEIFKEEIFNILGVSANYIGGGSGSLKFEKRPVIISEKGLLKDAATLALLDIPSGIGVGHGWYSVSEPIKITEVIGNEIISINWENAYNLYRSKVEGISKISFENKDFFEIAINYPLGITKMDSEMIVRDPIAVRGNETIVCAGQVPQNSFVHILSGDKDSLITGTIDAKRIAEESFSNTHRRKISEDKLVLFIDCASRAIFLRESFKCEVKAINEINAIGALSIGEIANTGKSYLELYNKTAVIGLLEV